MRILTIFEPLIDGLAFRPVAAARVYLTLKTTLLFLAFDMWLTRASHAGRYGAGGFNVAHFEWLGAIQPPVSPDLYVGVAVVTGALCFAIAIGDRAPRWLVGLALLTHTWSWAMSMLDSYQHHYLLSLVLLCLVFFPPMTAEQALLVVKPAPAPKKRKKGGKRGRHRAAPRLSDPAPLTSAWGFFLLAGSIAVVYVYTAYSKSDPEWLSGAALRSVLHVGIEAPAGDAPDPLGPFRGLLHAFGVQGEQVWYLMGHGVVLVQLICAAGYLLSPLRDAIGKRAPRDRAEGRAAWLMDLVADHALDAFLMVAFFTALSFHLGAEYMDLKIGWFSWYMVGYAAFFFLPARWLVVVSRALLPLRGARYGPEVLVFRGGVSFVCVVLGLATDTWPLTALGAFVALVGPARYVVRTFWLGPDETLPAPQVAGVVVLAALTSWIAGRWVDLPGAELASLAVAGGLLVTLAVVFLRWRDSLARLVGVSAGVIAGAACLYASVALSEVRWDYYRNVGGDHRRRGEPLEAYVAYAKANRYAPEGEDRQRQQSEMRELLEAQGVEVPEVR